MALSAALVLALAMGADPVAPCEAVTISLDEPAERAWALRIGDAVCGRVRHLQDLFGPGARGPVRVHILGGMDTWQKVTGRPWYVAAALVGERIVAQPARNLRRLRDPGGTLVHEAVHLMIRRTAGRNCPRWLDEGLAQWLSGQRSGLRRTPQVPLPADETGLAKLEDRLRSPGGDRTRLERDYGICLVLVDRLIRGAGEKELVRALAGLKHNPDPLAIEVKGKQLRAFLFE